MLAVVVPAVEGFQNFARPHLQHMQGKISVRGNSHRDYLHYCSPWVAVGGIGKGWGVVGILMDSDSIVVPSANRQSLLATAQKQ